MQKQIIHKYAIPVEEDARYIQRRLSGPLVGLGG